MPTVRSPGHGLPDGSGRSSLSTRTRGRFRSLSSTTGSSRKTSSTASRSWSPASSLAATAAVLLLQCLLHPTAVLLVAGEDFYKLLGISRDATPKEIKKAYRQKSLEFHPDKNKEEGAAEKFAEIARAYEVLTDEDKKSIYDRDGEEGLKRHEQGGGGGGGGFDDIFSHFGFNFQQRGGRGDGEQRTESVEIPLYLSLKDLYLGKTLEVQYVRQVLCLQWEMCVKPAQDCQGPGVKVQRRQIGPGFIQNIQTRDSRCISRGKMWKADCKECPRKTSTEKIDLTIDITPGMRNQEDITFEEVTDEKPGYKAGDLHFVIQEMPHDTYHRDRDDLYKTLEVPLVDALTGFAITLTHLDGHNFTVTVDEVTDCDHVMRVPGKGMPRRNAARGKTKYYGDLYLTFEVDFPDELTKQQKDAIREILAPGTQTYLGKADEDGDEL